MKVYKEILEALKIESVYVISDDTTFMCYPLEIEDTKWKVSCDSEFLSGKIKLKVNFFGDNFYLSASIERIKQEDSCSFIYEVVINEAEKKDSIQKNIFFMMLFDMEKDSREWNKRKEERYEIGLDEERISAIGFKSPEHIIVSGKKQLPCVVNNISYSGMKLTTMEGDFEKGKKVCICLSFVNPIEQIAIIGTIRNCFIKTTKSGEIVSVLSLEFKMPHYEYNKRVQKFIESLLEKKK